ncbi:MAG: TonB-dependent receptor plug domain-containing protein [Alphaproteobacteria bacterium]|nr:TonB-dependent receptor plug domain-containing protein [Alphaproteobacteria bacterium]
MTFRKFTAASAAALAAASLTPAAVYAQQTDSAIRGTIVDTGGVGISGARIVITHIPSGTTSSATASDSGSFFKGGLRVGGPYRITIDAPGFEGRVIEGIYLQPGNAERVVIDLDALRSTDEVLVIGQRRAQIDLNNGAGSSFTRDDIANQPSVTRDLVDTLVRDPLVNSSGGVGNISIAGVNPRYNALALDGVLQGDDFGLSSSIYPTGRSPISLASVEAVSVVASDYSVTSSGFQGGLVNVVTKSGTNEFHGSGYWYRSGQDFLGELSEGAVVPAPEFKEREYGFSLGGPIIKDRLFFFANWEKFSTSSPVNFAGTDAANGIIDSDRFFSAINQRILEGTGFDAGGRPVATSTPAEVTRFLGKIDFNINDDHRFEGSYQRTREAGVSSSSTSLVSAWYDTPRDLDSYSFGVYSDWSDAFSTEVRLGIKDQVNGQLCRAGSDFSDITLQELSAASIAADPLFAGTIDGSFTDITITGGCDRFRHANEFDDNRVQIYAAGDYTWGDHVSKFGVEWENYDLRNVFLSDANGTFRYDDLNELATNTGVNVTLRSGITGNKDDAAAEWGYKKLSVFLQDDWQLASNFEFNVGVRYERYFQSDEPPLRQDFLAAYGRDNLDNLDGIDIIQPRFGFRYEPFSRTTVTGGFGLFSGGNPQVWVSNAFQPQIFEVAQTLDGVTPGTIPPSVLAAIQASDPTTPTFIDTISPDFKIPSQWKGSLRVDQGFDLNFGGFADFGTDYRLTVQYLYSDIKNDFVWRNIAQTDLGLAQGVAPDGRSIYADLQALGVNNAIELGNVSGGRSHVISVALAKQYEMGFNFDVSYAFQDVESITPGTSSRAVSNYRSLVTFDRNNPEVGTAPFETRHAFNINLGYENEWIGDLTTRVDLFGTISSGQPFSYTFDVGSTNALFGRSGNGENPFDNDLLYIPSMSGGASTDAAVVFASGFDGAAFESFVADAGLAQGAVNPKNNDRSEWNSLWNFRLQQDLPTPNFGFKPLEQNQLKLVVDILNIANLINDKWGTQNFATGFDTLQVVRADLVSAADVAALGVDAAPALTGNAPATTCATAGSCVYRYNAFSPRQVSIKDPDQSVYRIRVGIQYDF